MLVRLWDRKAKSLEWRQVVMIDSEWITTHSLQDGMPWRFRRDTGTCENWPELRIDREDLASLNSAYERRGGWLNDFNDEE